MRRETGARLRAAMTDQGVDALILLGNANVVYATGASWPLIDAGLSHVERPVAVVLADDEYPHLFLPFREGASDETDLPADHLHGPMYLDFDEGVEHFAQVLADLVPAGATVAVDELTGAMHRAAGRLFPGGAPVDAAPEVGRRQAGEDARRDRLPPPRLRITEQAMVDVQTPLAPGVRQIDLTATFVRRVFELGANANVLDPIWQVMPTTKAEGVWTTHGDLALPLLTTERELAKGDVLWVDVSITYSGYHSDFGRTWVVGQEPTARQHAQFDQWRAILDAVLAVTKAGATCGDLARAAIAANGGAEAVDAALLPRPRARHRQRRDAHDRNGSRRGVRRQLRPRGRHGARARAGRVGRRHRRLPKRGDRGHHRGRLDALTDYPYDPYGQ